MPTLTAAMARHLTDSQLLALREAARLGVIQGDPAALARTQVLDAELAAR